MGLGSDLYAFWVFIWESLYNFFRWTPFGPKKCKYDGRMDGKVVVITGATSGIGRETAKYLTSKGAKVIMACKDEKKGDVVADEIQRECPSGQIEARHCDLSSLTSVRQFAAKLEHETHIDVLINNAGVMMCPFVKTVDGNEMHFSVNHLGHFLLTHLLMDKLKKAQNARIINVTSTSYLRASPEGINFNDINFNTNRKYSPHLVYSQTKLANILFTRELGKRLRGTNVHAYVVYPGMVRTNLSRHITGLYGFIWKVTSWFVFRSAELGAQTTIFCATDKETGRESGHFYNDCKLVPDQKLLQCATDEHSAQKLWGLSSDLVGINSTTI